MAVQKIEYENKTYLQNDPNVPEKNKVTEDNMNEIKSKVNNNADELSAAQQNIEDLQEGQGTSSSDITSLKNRVTTLEGDNTKNKQDIANKVDKVDGKGLSTEDYTTAEKEKLAGLSNYNDTEIKQDIQDLKDDVSDIKTEQETQNDLLERTQNALINITTEKSSNINVKDSSDLNAKIGVYGISEQETREGYNLFNNTKTISNVTYNSEEDKWVFNLSNIYDHIALKDNFFENIKANTTYTMYLNILKNTANNIITFNPSNTVWSAGFNIQAGKTGVVINNIKTKEDLSTALYDLWFSHLNTITGEFEAQIMLLEGTFTLQNIPNYEKYGASPSPEFPSEIENVTGDIDITVCNKSLFNNTKTISNVTYNSEEDKWVFNLPGKYDHIASKGTFFKNIKANTNYTLYFNILKNTSSAAILFNLTNTIWNNNIQISAGQTGVVVNNIKTREDLSTALYDLWFSHSNAITGEFEAQIMICEGSETDNNYVKYQEQLITFPLSEGQKLYKGDYPGSNGIHHVRKQIELDGTENWVVDNQASPSTCLGWKILVDDYVGYEGDFAPHGDILCSHFVDRNTYNNELDGISGGWGKWIFIKMKAKDLSSPNLTGFKSFLAEQKTNGTPVTIEYPLAEEEIEPYAEEQQEAYNKLQNVLSYYNETNVFADKAQLVFKYIADTQTWVLNKLNNINQQILEIAGGN